MPRPLLNQACYHSISLITLSKTILLLHGNPLASIYLCIITVQTRLFGDRSIALFRTANKMLINLPNEIGKIKNKQDMHVCAQDLCITEALNHSNILLQRFEG